MVMKPRGSFQMRNSSTFWRSLAHRLTAFGGTESVSESKALLAISEEKDGLNEVFVAKQWRFFF